MNVGEMQRKLSVWSMLRLQEPDNGLFASRKDLRLYDLYQAGKLIEALALFRRMQPLNKLLWTLPFNPVAKASAALSGRNVGECRRPVLPLTAEQMAQVKEAMAPLLKAY